jgi:hypothetical protein
MQNANQSPLDELQYYFVVKQTLPDGNVKVTLSNYAPFRDDQTTLSFDTEEDTALYLLEEARNGSDVSFNDRAIAQAIIRGDQPLFLYEEKQSNGTLLLSLHDELPPTGLSAIAFGSRSPYLIARFLLRRLQESSHTQATEETIKQAKELIN